MNKIINYIISLIGVVFLSTCILEDEGPLIGNDLGIGDKIPQFSVFMNNGEKISSEDLIGNVSLIVFFNTSCNDCRKELPVIQCFHESYPQYPLLCISREEGEESVAKYWERFSFTMPYSAQDNRTIYQLFAQKVIPRVYVVDKEGFIRYVFMDSPLATYDDLLKAVIELCE